MTTSGSIDFSISRDNVITDELLLVGALGDGESPTSVQITTVSRALNRVVKSLQARVSISIWARKTGYILPITNTNSVNLGSTGGHATTSYNQTTLSNSPISGSSSINVTSATGFVVGYYIGIEKSDNTMFWTTISSVSSTTIGLTSALDGDTASGGYVYVYQTKITRPLRIINAYLHDHSSGFDRPIQIVSKQEYDMLGAKTSASIPNQLVYDPQLGNGIAYFYPQMSDGKSCIIIIIQRPFEDFDAASDTPDFPQEWYDVLTYLTAVRIAPIYGMPYNDRQVLRQEANMLLDDALGNEPETGSIFLQVNMDGY